MNEKLRELLNNKIGKCHCVYCVGTREDLAEYAGELEVKLHFMEEEIKKLHKIIAFQDSKLFSLTEKK